MKAYSKLLAVSAAVMLTGAAGVALAIEAFSERFEEDFSSPKTILARVIIVDPYEDAVWVNWTWKGVRNSGEIDQFWGKLLPGKNMRVFASGKDLELLKSKARPTPGPAAAEKVAPGTNADVVEMVVQEVEQNKRVATAVTKLGGNVLSSQVELEGAQAKDGYISVVASCEIETGSGAGIEPIPDQDSPVGLSRTASLVSAGL